MQLNHVCTFKRKLGIQDYISGNNLGFTEVQVGCPLRGLLKIQVKPEGKLFARKIMKT